jgi:hypothetical protein
VLAPALYRIQLILWQRALKLGIESGSLPQWRAAWLSAVWTCRAGAVRGQSQRFPRARASGRPVVKNNWGGRQCNASSVRSRRPLDPCATSLCYLTLTSVLPFLCHSIARGVCSMPELGL